MSKNGTPNTPNNPVPLAVHDGVRHSDKARFSPPSWESGDIGLKTISLAERTVCEPLRLPSSTTTRAPPGATRLHSTAVAAALLRPEKRGRGEGHERSSTIEHNQSIGSLNNVSNNLGLHAADEFPERGTYEMTGCCASGQKRDTGEMRGWRGTLVSLPDDWKGTLRRSCQ